eukprot:SM000139S00128  [mRNA]  locus=s139:308636:312000:+ [translate_table: standard]
MAPMRKQAPLRKRAKLAAAAAATAATRGDDGGGGSGGKRGDRGKRGSKGGPKSRTNGDRREASKSAKQLIATTDSGADGGAGRDGGNGGRGDGAADAGKPREGDMPGGASEPAGGDGAAAGGRPAKRARLASAQHDAAPVAIEASHDDGGKALEDRGGGGGEAGALALVTAPKGEAGSEVAAPEAGTALAVAENGSRKERPLRRNVRWLGKVAAEERANLPRDVLKGRSFSSWKEDSKREDLKVGRFSKEEDRTIVAAVLEYVRVHGWEEDEGIQRLLKPRTSKMKGVWLELAKALPDRHVKRVYMRALRLLDKRNYVGQWTAEEEDTLRRLYAEHGPKWSKLAGSFGRLPGALKDKWREIKNGGHQEGKFTAAEVDKLCDLVHEAVRSKSKAIQPQDIEVGGRQIRDDINWTWISKHFPGRTYNQCLRTWYYRIAPSMVLEGSWGPRDDQRLLESLLECGEDYDTEIQWDTLLDNRSGETCKKRWKQIKKHLPDGYWTFEEQVEMACKRLAPELIQSPPQLIEGPAGEDNGGEDIEALTQVEDPVAPDKQPQAAQLLSSSEAGSGESEEGSEGSGSEEESSGED